MIYTHVLQSGPCGIKSPLTRVRKIQSERGHAMPSPAQERLQTIDCRPQTVHIPKESVVCSLPSVVSPLPESTVCNLQSSVCSPITPDPSPKKSTVCSLRSVVFPLAATIQKLGIAAMWAIAVITGKRSL